MRLQSFDKILCKVCVRDTLVLLCSHVSYYLTTNINLLFTGLKSNILWSEMMSETVDGRYKCEQCGTATYKHKRSLYRHLRDECGEVANYHCHFCHYRAKQKGSLKKHLIGIHKKIIDL